jgi:hypothetical protein
MQKWLKDGIIGWGAVAALTIIVSLSIDAPYEFIPTVQYGLLWCWSPHCLSADSDYYC